MLKSLAKILTESILILCGNRRKIKPSLPRRQANLRQVCKFTNFIANVKVCLHQEIYPYDWFRYERYSSDFLSMTSVMLFTTSHCDTLYTVARIPQTRHRPNKEKLDLMTNHANTNA